MPTSLIASNHCLKVFSQLQNVLIKREYLLQKKMLEQSRTNLSNRGWTVVTEPVEEKKNKRAKDWLEAWHNRARIEEGVRNRKREGKGRKKAMQGRAADS